MGTDSGTETILGTQVTFLYSKIIFTIQFEFLADVYSTTKSCIYLQHSVHFSGSGRISSGQKFEAQKQAFAKRTSKKQWLID